MLGKKETFIGCNVEFLEVLCFIWHLFYQGRIGLALKARLFLGNPEFIFERSELLGKKRLCLGEL